MADIRVTTTSGKKNAGSKVVAKKTPAKTSAKTVEVKNEAPVVTRKPIAKKAATAKPQVDTKSMVTPEERQRMIAEAAYLRAERRGFSGGDPTNDWLSAEAEIDQILSRT